MNLSFAMILASVLQVFALSAAGQMVDLSEKDSPLEKVLDKITRQTGYFFLYGDESLKNSKPVNVLFSHVPLDEALRRIFSYQSLAYEIDGKTVIIKSETTSNAALQPQRITVKGRVIDSLGNPLERATVVLQGTRLFTYTDGSGKFSLTNIIKGSILQVSFLGYTPKLLIAKQGDLGAIILQPVANELNEVAVISNGIFERPAENFTGAATSFTGQQLRQISPTSVLLALKALDASFQMPTDNVNGSDPNVVPRVQVRGTNSIMQTDMESEYGYISNPPLIIIDGFESTLQVLFDMDINRINKLTILKDAAATALYGSKSANGVIVIETIQPTAGHSQIYYTTNIGVTMPDLTSFNLMDAQEKLRVEEIGGYYRSRDFTTQQRLDDLHNLVKHNVAMGVNTYWLSQPLHTDITQSHNLQLGGGSNKLTYQTIFNYAKSGGVVKGSNRNNFSGSAQVKYKSLNGKLSVQAQFSLSKTDGVNSPYGSFSQYTSLNPYWMIRDENGNITRYIDVYPTGGSNGLLASSYTSNVINPLYNTTLNTVNKLNSQTIQQSLWGEWKIFPDLKINSTFSYSNTEGQTDVFLPGSASNFFSTSDFSKRGSYNQNSSKSSTYQSRTLLNFGKTIDKHTIYVSGGVDLNQTSSEALKTSVIGFPSDRLNDLLFGLNYSSTKPSGSYNLKRTAGFLGNISYAFDSRFLVDGSYRSDGSSVFGKNKRFGQMWAIGTGWNIHKEKFFKESKVLSKLKLRGSYGFTGSVDFPSYASVTTYEYQTDGRYLDFIPAVVKAMGNPDLLWQRTKKLNVGADFGLFKDRVTATFNYYNEITDDLIMSNASAPSTGFSSYYNNLGKSKNKGYEIYFTSFIFKRPEQKLFWSISTSFYHNENKLVEITDELRNQNASALKTQRDSLGNITPVSQYEEGKSVSTLYAVRSKGIDPSNGYEIFLDKNGQQTYVWSQDDLVAMGDRQPKLKLTLNNNFQYKWLRLNFGINLSLGGVTYNSTLASKIENVNLGRNLDRRALKDRWQTPGVAADYKGLTDLEGYTRTGESTPVTSRFVQKANTIEITGLSIDPGALLEKYINKFVNKGINKLNNTVNSVVDQDRVSIRFYMNNAFTISNLKRETGTSYPLNRSYSLTVRVKL